MAKKPARKASKPSAGKSSRKDDGGIFHEGRAAHDDDKIFALLGTALPLIGYVIAVLAKKNTAYATFYGKQGVVLFVTWLIAMAITWVLELVPVIGGVLSGIVWVLFIILWVVGILNALSGEARDLPVIGMYAGRF